MKKLDGRVAVVTGAGSGIGRATAARLAREGCRLVVSDVNEAPVRETRELIERAGGEAREYVVDVANREAMRAFADEVARVHGVVHIVVNNAGVSVSAPFVDMPLEDIDWIVGVNLWGVIHGCKFFLPHLLAADEGHIVNVSSVFGFIGVPTQSAYAATKFAVRGFTESLRAELSTTSVGVTSVHPGPIKTNLARTARVHVKDEAFRARTLEFFETQGITPEECAEPIVKAIRRNAPRVLITPHTLTLELSKRLMPETTDWIATKLARLRGVV